MENELDIEPIAKRLNDLTANVGKLVDPKHEDIISLLDDAISLLMEIRRIKRSVRRYE
jgi:hypothetical protein